jgi:hypothetical protein
MQGEAEITVNGTKLTHDEARIVRLAHESFADILENQIGYEDNGVPISDKYVTDTAHMLTLFAGPVERKQ